MPRAQHESEHRASIARQMAPPRGLPALLSWFLAAFRDEVPDALHVGGVWRDRPRRGDAEGYQPVGGSLLGTPRTAPGADTFVEDHPRATELAQYEGHLERDRSYVYPLRAALSMLAGRGPLTEARPYMARFLYTVALNDGDWRVVADRAGILPQVAPTYTEQALRELWRRYDVMPPNRLLSEQAVA